MNNVIAFQSKKPAPKKAKTAPVFNVPLTKIAEAIQAVRFIEDDLPAAEELLEAFARAVREGKREVNVTTPAALAHARYFSYREPDWESAHSAMFSLVIGLT